MILNRINSVIVIFLSALSFGQTKLSAKDAVFIALENNYQIQIAEKQLAIAQKNNKWTEAGLFPTVELNIAQNNTIQDNSNNPFTFTPGVIMSNSLNPTLSAYWNLFSGFSLFISKEQLEQLEAQSANNSIVIIENTVQDVLKAYYTAKLQSERTKLFETILDLSRDRYNYYALKEKYSGTTSLEVLQFRNQYLTDSTNLLLQQISYDNSIRNLKLLMNEKDSKEDYILTDQLDPQLSLIDIAQAKKDLLANNANLKNQYISLQLQQTATNLKKAFLFPTLSFQAGVQPGWSSLRDIKDPSFSANIHTVNYYGNLNLRYTIFNNWKNKRALEVSKIQEEISSLNVESMEKNLLMTLENLVALYDARSQLVQISVENMEYAKQAFLLAEKKFELGTINSIDLASFQNNYQNTMVQHYENLFNRLDTYLEIYKMTGKISLDYQK